jgi:hypothetical protein
LCTCTFDVVIDVRKILVALWYNLNEHCLLPSIPEREKIKGWWILSCLVWM